MFMSTVDAVSCVLFAALDPHHLYNLSLVNKTLHQSIDDGVRDANKKAAMAKYKRLVVLPNNTFRIHSIYGKTAIELILPVGEIDGTVIVRLSMNMDGRAYHGYPEYRRCEMDGKKADLSSYVFHAQSSKLLGADSVYIDRIKTLSSPLNGFTLEIRIVLGRKEGGGLQFTLFFAPDA